MSVARFVREARLMNATILGAAVQNPVRPSIEVLEVNYALESQDRH